MGWFDVDKEGLAKILERRGKVFALYELIQNAWDQNVKEVRVDLTPVEGRPNCILTVEDDDPDGFKDLSHAYTLFAESDKKADPTKRGRFNLGEKLVLAICKEATIQTTKGTITFTDDGQRGKTKIKTKSGSKVTATLRMTRDEYSEVCDAVLTLIPPSDIDTYFNGKKLSSRRCRLGIFEVPLPTEIADNEGLLKRTTRKTFGYVYDSLVGRPGYIYEMGIPVVETGDKYDVDIQQKVPLNMDRDNVTPRYLQLVRTAVLNEMYSDIHENEATESWVRDAAGDKDCDQNAFERVATLRFGENRVSFDPSDAEANNKAFSEGYNVVSGGSMSRGEWNNARKFDSIKPAGQVTPSTKTLTSPEGKPWDVVDPSKYKEGMHEVVEMTSRLAYELLKIPVTVQIVRGIPSNDGSRLAACYGNAVFRYNLKVLGKNFFADAMKNQLKVLDLIIHELGHQYESNHLSEKYYRSLTELGAQMTLLAIRKPELFVIGETAGV